MKSEESFWTLWRRYFRIRRDERGLFLAVVLFFIALNALTICRYYETFTPLSDNYWNLFIRHFQVSGFDPITYYVVSDWEARYNVFRHPLLSFMMVPPYLLNQWLMLVTGINCVQFVVAAMLVFCAAYSFLFLHRILREVVGVGRWDATLLSTMLFSFAFVMLSAMVPDHFILSMFMLLLTLYIAGKHLVEHRQMSGWKTILLFVLTAGISLNNGLKVFLSSLFVNGRRFFRPLHLVFAVVVPALLMWGFCRYEYKVFVFEHEKARHEAKARAKAEKKKQEQENMARDTLFRANNALPVPSSKPRAPHQAKQGKPMMKGEFMRWTDITTSRWHSAVENLFGESIQLHQDYLLKDEFRSRPMIVNYRGFFPYVVEAVLVLLFLVGIWCGRKSRFLWLSLSFFFLDMALHMGLGFGINEVYIMSAHWIYVLPIAMGYLLLTCPGRFRLPVRLLLMMLTVYLYAYNGFLLVNYMIE